MKLKQLFTLFNPLRIIFTLHTIPLGPCEFSISIITTGCCLLLLLVPSMFRIADVFFFQFVFCFFCRRLVFVPNTEAYVIREITAKRSSPPSFFVSTVHLLRFVCKNNNGAEGKWYRIVAQIHLPTVPPHRRMANEKTLIFILETWKAKMHIDANVKTNKNKTKTNRTCAARKRKEKVRSREKREEKFEMRIVKMNQGVEKTIEKYVKCNGMCTLPAPKHNVRSELVVSSAQVKIPTFAANTDIVQAKQPSR